MVVGKVALGVSVRTKKDYKVYSVKWRENGEERQCKSIQLPRPELEAALDAAGSFIPEICMISKENIKWLETAGGTFDYTETGKASLTLGVSLGLANGCCYDFKSPAIGVDMENTDSETATEWRERFSVIAKMLADEIILYAEGSRAQQVLSFDGEDNNGGENEHD